MMKRGLSLAAAVLSLLLAAGLCSAQNTDFNGGFEKKGSEKTAEGWMVKVYRDCKVETLLDGETKHSGKFSFKIDFTGKGGRVMLYPEDPVKNVQPGRTYEVSMWIKARDLDYSPNFIAPVLRFNYEPTKVRPYPIIDLMTELKGEKGWKRVSKSCRAPSDAEELEFRIMLTNGTVWIDDVAVSRID